jgi:ATP-dependent DNA helicase RecG
MKKLRLKDREIVENEHSATVHIRHASPASPQDTVMSYLDANEEITNRKARELTGIRFENSMKNVFLSLKGRHLIEPVPGKTTGGGAA